MSMNVHHSRFRMLVIAAAGVLLCAVIAIGLAIEWLRSDAILEGYRDADNLAIVLSEQTNRSVQSIDLMLSEIQYRIEASGGATADDYRRTLQSREMYNLMADRLSRLTQAAFIGLVDVNGNLVNTTNKWPLPPTDVSDREYFQHFQTGHDKSVFIAKPVADRVDGAQTIIFAKRLNDANDAFVGLITIGIKLRHFQQIYGSLTSLPEQSFQLLRDDGTVIVRYPSNAGTTTEMMPKDSPWYRLVSRGGGTYRSSNRFDGITRLIAVRPLPDYPLVINVGTSEAATLAAWRKQSLTIAIGALVVFICFIFLLRALINNFKQLAISEALLQDERRKVDAALDNMSQGICMFDAEQRLIVCNKRYAELYGLTDEQTRPGTLLCSIVEKRIAAGSAPEDRENHDRLNQYRIDKPYRVTNRLRDGRYIFVAHMPTANGGWVATHEDVTDRLKTEEQIVKLAHYDALTGLPNRALFNEVLDQALTRVPRGERLALLYLDLDHFKRVNDTLGHLVGDDLLRQTADRLRSCVRNADLIARLGGDEFAILQMSLGQPSDVAVLAARIGKSMRTPFDLAGHQTVVGVSIGIALAPADALERDQLLKNADLALYGAKDNGRGTYYFYEPELDTRMKARQQLETDLREALAKRQFELYYQPIVDLHTNHVVGCEALLRWHHPERGLVSPAEFIPAAEESGIIIPLGEWVLRRACFDAATWPPHISVAVNISAAQMKGSALAPLVVSALAASGIAASRLELEITESLLMQDTFATLSTLHHLHDLGVRIAMDDFGTGYSSLSYLRSFPFNKIKIDRSFIQNISENGNTVAIVQSVTNMARQIGMTTTAEGIETEEQRRTVQDLGCNQMQGYLFSHPRPLAEIIPLFEIGAKRIINAA